MKSNVDRMMDRLAPAIDQKCGELRAARRERLQSRIFAVLCAMAALLPALLVYAGLSLTLLLAPLCFMSLSVLLLLPVLLSSGAQNQGGILYENT